MPKSPKYCAANAQLAVGQRCQISCSGPQYIPAQQGGPSIATYACAANGQLMALQPSSFACKASMALLICFVLSARLRSLLLPQSFRVEAGAVQYIMFRFSS